MVTPIDHTVFTRTEAAITFVNPKGDPLVTQPEETLLSTSYITGSSSTDTPTPKASPRVSSPVALETSTSTKGSCSVVKSSRQATIKPSDRLSSNATASGTIPQAPMFTYEPKGSTTASDEQRPTVVITISSFTTITQDSNSTESQTGQPSVPTNSNLIPSTTLLQSTIALPSSPNNGTVASTQVELSSSAQRTVFVTSTQYTTLFPSSQTSSQAATEPSPQLSSSAVATEPANSTLTQSSSLSATQATATLITSSSTPPSLPTSSLSPPPVIVITPSVATVSESAALSSVATETSSNGGAGFAYPTQGQAASSDVPPASPSTSSSTSAVVPSASSVAQSPSSESTPAPTSPASSPSAAPSPAPSSTSSGPLIVVPINTSQMLTVTQTVTATTTEKETVTVTATVKA